MGSPMQRSLAVLRERGYLAEVVERWIPGANIRKDFAGFIDILGVHREREGDVIAVQTTTAAHLAERIAKILEHENLGVIRKANIAIWAHGWSKRGGRWHLREENLS